MVARVLYLGQKPIGEDGFFRLMTTNGRNIDVVGAVSNTRTDDWWRSNRIFRWCRDHEMEFVSNQQRSNEAIRALVQKQRADTIISVQHPWILPAETLKAVDGRAFNLHLAKLPQYRGYHSCSHAILNGDDSYSVSLHWMIPEVDAGDIAYTSSFPIGEFDTAASIYERAVAAGEALLELLIDDLIADRSPPRNRHDGVSRFYPRSELNQHRRIKDNADLEEIERKARAFYFPPYEPAFILHRGRKIYVLPQQLMQIYGA